MVVYNSITNIIHVPMVLQLYKTLQLRATARDRRGGLQLSERAM